MKRTITITLLLAFVILRCKCQQYDATWSLGYLPITTLSFNADSAVLDSIKSPYYYNLTNANICDENGSFLYTTNGVYILDKNGDTLQNSTGINACTYTTQYECCGLNIPQAALFIPEPGNKRYYYLIHFTNDDSSIARPQTLYYTLIDKQGNNGLGSVIEKNMPILSNTPLREGGMTACKHANGRDYWLTIGASDRDEFYKFLITPTGILGPYLQSIGPSFPGPYDIAYSRFSLDGSKYVTGVYEGYVLVMDFDRCTGLFSNPIWIFNLSCYPPASPCSGSSSVEFSPNNRFVYVANLNNLTQYDLFASNIHDSVQIYITDSNQNAGFDMLQMAPNGKMYLSTWGGILGFDSIHVINNPNAKGDSCNFVYGGQPIAWATGGSLPNMANYRLGPLVGSGCDTITAISQQPAEISQMRLQPNPADKYVYVEMGQEGDYELQLLNTLGQTIATQQTKQVANFNTEGLASGVYFIKAAPKSPSRLGIRDETEGTWNTNTIRKLIVTH